MSIKVYGASDDLIEVEGGISEEFSPLYDDEAEGVFLAFSDGTVLHVVYGQGGMWRITPRHLGAATYSKREATNPDDDYSDVVTLEKASITWVVMGTSMALAPTKTGESDDY